MAAGVIPPGTTLSPRDERAVPWDEATFERPQAVAVGRDGSLAAVSEDRGRSNHPSQWERYWRMREGIDAWHQPVHKPHPPGRKLHRPILVSTLTEADIRYLEWLEHNWDFVDGGEH